MVAVILESGEPERLYTGLSLLASAAADGREARGLISHGALPVLLDPPERLRELWATTRELVRLEACSAAVQFHGLTRDDLPFEVTSVPRFLGEVQGWQLVAL